MPTYKFSFPSDATGKLITVSTVAGVVVDTIPAGTYTGSVSTVEASYSQGATVVTSVLDIGEYVAEAEDARLFYSAHATGVLDVPLSLEALPATISAAPVGTATAAALALKLNSSTPRIAYAPSAGTGYYDRLLNLYNLKSNQLRRFRGYLAAASKGSECRIALFGDSIVAGQGVTDKAADSYPAALRAALTLKHTYCGPGPVLCHLGDTGINPQWSTTGTWVKFNPGATDRTPLYQSTSAGGTATFVSTNTGTIVEVWYSNSSAAFTVTIDGGSAVVVTPAGGSTIGKYQVTGLADTTHTVLVTRTGSAIYVAGATVRKTTGVSVGAFGLGGARLSDTNLSQSYDLRSFTIGWAPHLAVIGFMSNEASTGVTAATFKTNLQSAITAFVAAGVDILLIDQIPASSLTLTDYRTAVYELADTNDLPVLSMFDRWGSYTTVNAIGMMFDGVHPSAIGYRDYGNAVAAVLAP